MMRQCQICVDLFDSVSFLDCAIFPSSHGLVLQHKSRCMLNVTVLVIQFSPCFLQSVCRCSLRVVFLQLSSCDCLLRKVTFCERCVFVQVTFVVYAIQIRLQSTSTGSEVHRAVRPDGSICQRKW